MTRCAEFYQKFERDGNWCDICKSGVSQILSYLDLISEFQAGGIPKKFTIVNFSENAARPLLWEKNQFIKQQAIDLIREVLRAGKRCTAGDTKRILQRLRNNGRFSNPDELPIGLFNIIYADPPWPYEHCATVSRAIESHYPTMTIEQICEFGAKIPSAENSILFLWATNPKLSEACEVLKAWHFNYRTNFVWVKDKIGMGYYCRAQHELLLVAVKGEVSPPPPENRVSSVLSVQRRKHSEKPAEFYSIIEKMYPCGSRLELFARQKREGWVSWGNEVESS